MIACMSYHAIVYQGTLLQLDISHPSITRQSDSHRYYRATPSHPSQVERGQLVTLDLLAESDLFQQGIGTVDVVVDDNNVVSTLDGVSDLVDSGVETLVHRFLRLGSTSLQPGLEIRQRRRRQEQEDGVQRRVVRLDELDSLSINVEDTPSLLISHILDGLDARSISVTRELSILDKLFALDHFDELVLGCEMVVDAIDFARTRSTSGVRDGKAELGRMGGKESVEEGRLAGSRRTTDDEGLQRPERHVSRQD